MRDSEIHGAPLAVWETNGCSGVASFPFVRGQIFASMSVEPELQRDMKLSRDPLAILSLLDELTPNVGLDSSNA